jgi:hypothetical protein
MKNRICAFVLLGICGCVVLSSAAQNTHAITLASWDFSSLDYTGLPNNDLAPNPILVAANGNAGAGVSLSDLTPSAELRLTNTANTAAGEADLLRWDLPFGGTGDGVNDEYIEFTMTADTPGTLNIDSISISEWRNGAGAPNGMAFDVNVDGGGFALYDAIQNDPNSGDSMFDTFTFSQAIANASDVVIRFTPRNNGEGGTGDLHINGLTVEGSIAQAAVPEPTSLLFVAATAMGTLFLRRRRRRC